MKSDLDALRGDVLAAYPRVLEALGDDLTETTRRLLQESQARLAEGKYYLVVCGEFRRGKSSLLNALVERPNLFPVDVDITTCAVTTLDWGEQDRAIVVLADPADTRARPQTREIRLEQVRDYVTEQGNPANRKHVRLIQLHAPVPQLQSGLVLVDTPGIGSMNVEHTTATYAFLPSADAILFVASAVEPLTTYELRFLADALEKSPVVITAITKTDQVVDPGPVVEEARRRIAQTTGHDPADLLIVPVSAMAKRDALDSGDADELADSGFPELEAELWGRLAVTCGAAQLNHALDGLDAAVMTAAATVANELGSLADDDELQRIAAELDVLHARARALRADRASWRSDLAEQMRERASSIRRSLDADLDRVTNEARLAAANPGGAPDPHSVMATAASGVVDAAQRADRMLRVAAAEVAEESAAQTALPLTASGLSVKEFEPRAPTSGYGTPRRRSRFHMALASRGHGLAGGVEGSALGAIIGTFVFPGVGTAAGAAIGGLFGTVAGLVSGYREESRRAGQDRAVMMVQTILPIVESSCRQARDWFEDAASGYARMLVRQLSDALSVETESVEESRRRVGANLRRGRSERAERRRVVEARGERYTSLRQALEELRARVARLGRDREEGWADTSPGTAAE